MELQVSYGFKSTVVYLRRMDEEDGGNDEGAELFTPRNLKPAGVELLTQLTVFLMRDCCAMFGDLERLLGASSPSSVRGCVSDAIDTACRALCYCSSN